MKINPTIVLIFFWLVGTVAAGVISGLKGYNLAEISLKGVAQPKEIAVKKPGENSPKISRQEKALKFVDEKKIIASVQNYIQLESDQSPNSIEQQDYQATSLGVILKITKIYHKEDTLYLEVKMTNKTGQALRFLYNTLEVKNETGREISPITEGLPEEITGNGKEYSGVVKIPLALLDNSQKLSLSLSNYPDQKVQLTISQIPIKK